MNPSLFSFDNGMLDRFLLGLRRFTSAELVDCFVIKNVDLKLFLRTLQGRSERRFHACSCTLT